MSIHLQKTQQTPAYVAHQTPYGKLRNSNRFQPSWKTMKHAFTRERAWEKRQKLLRVQRGRRIRRSVVRVFLDVQVITLADALIVQER